MAFRNNGPSLELVSCELLTIWESLVYGITSVMSNKENGILSTPAVWLMVFLIPLAIPRFSAGTDPITELEFAGANSASPKPNSRRLINNVL